MIENRLQQIEQRNVREGIDGPCGECPGSRRSKAIDAEGKRDTSSPGTRLGGRWVSRSKVPTMGEEGNRMEDRRVKKKNAKKPFTILPKRWIVERTFGWLNRYRRLSKDYEALTSTAETMIFFTIINLMVHRLAPG